YLPKCPLTEEFSHCSKLHDLQEEVQVIIDEDDDRIDDALNFHKDQDESLNENYCIDSDAVGGMINCEYDECNNNDLNIDDATDCSTSDNDSSDAESEEVCLHEYTNVSTKYYCTDLLNYLRAADISKSHSTHLTTLIKSILPTPNHLPATMDDLLLFMNIDNLFSRRSICLICKGDLEYKQRKCLNCKCCDEKSIADIYDINLKDVFTKLVKRLTPIIEEYKQKIYNNIDEQETKDIPLILHLDGVGLTRSSKLKMWLFSGSIVELPPICRYRRYNIILMSIWVAYTEPKPDLWLRPIISQIESLKMQDIVINENINYKLKIYGITGDCPALRLILNFISHNDYYCCWLCYVPGEHIGSKRQYKIELPMIMRNKSAYEYESNLAEEKILMWHGKALISNLYYTLKPIHRLEVDNRLKRQNFPHYFNRKMRPISNFGFVQATEIKNILFYGLLPIFQSYLPIEKLSHLALFVCFTRLLHAESIFGSKTSNVAHDLFQHFYHDHDEYYCGLQNLVLHLHTHFKTMYNNHDALSNIGCFGQEDLIGSIGSNHHGTRYYGELITYYYNIDFSLHNKPTKTKAIIEKIDLVNDAVDKYHDLHAQLCDCEQLHKCFNIYRRFIIKDRMFHSLMYNKRGKSPTRKKSKKKFYPSDPLQAYYYLISHDDPEKYRVIGRSSVQKITNDKAVVTNIAGDVRILKSGTLDYCRKELKLKVQEMEEQNEDKAIDEQDEDDDDNDDIKTNDDDDDEMSEDEDNDDDSYIGQSSTSCLKRPSDGFSTHNRSALKRSYNKAKTTSQSNQRFNRDRSLQRNGRCQSKVTASHDLPAKNNSNNNHPDKITGNVSRFTSSSQDDHRHIDTNIESKFKQEMISGIRSLKKTVSKLTKTVEYLTIPSSPKNDQLSSYRDENDKENFQDEISWDGKNLLKVSGRDIGDYARKLLDILFTTQELQSSILPSQAAHLYQKEVLDEDRFKILN
ncbi:unnamed protein product, partial [Rotaria magnacalcarata]